MVLTFRRYELSPELKNIKSRTDCHLDDEAAAVARTEHRQRSEQRRAEEAARIEAENFKNRERLSRVKEKVDDGDGPDEKADASGLRTLAMNDFAEQMAQAYIQKSKAEFEEHRERVVNKATKIGEYKEDSSLFPYYPADDAIDAARSQLRDQSEARRQAEREAIRERNAEYFERVHSASSVTDTKIWDDGDGSAGAMRSVVAAQSKERKADELKQLAAKNQAMKDRLSKVVAKTDDGADLPGETA